MSLTDYCSNDGARSLGDAISRYWKRLGFDVEITYVTSVASREGTVTALRSDMLNGWPRRRSE